MPPTPCRPPPRAGGFSSRPTVRKGGSERGVLGLPGVRVPFGDNLDVLPPAFFPSDEEPPRRPHSLPRNWFFPGQAPAPGFPAGLGWDPALGHPGVPDHPLLIPFGHRETSARAGRDPGDSAGFGKGMDGASPPGGTGAQAPGPFSARTRSHRGRPRSPVGPGGRAGRCGSRAARCGAC